MLDLEAVDCIVQAGHAVEVLVGSQVANIALNKHLAGCKAKDLIGLHQISSRLIVVG